MGKMWPYILKRKKTILASVAIIVLTGYFLFTKLNTDPLRGLISTTVEFGTVENLVSVSGIIEAKGTADLAFPSTGVVSKVYVQEGDSVLEGDIMATLGAEALVAQREGALAELRLAEADRDQLLSGVRGEERAITNTSVSIAEADLAKTKSTQNQSIENARRTLLSTGLEAVTSKETDQATPPTITGTYKCTKEGQYHMAIYNSGANSGYSLILTGLESGTYTVSTDQPSPVGECGLFAQFSNSSRYTNSDWTINIPNTRASTYTANKNNLELAQITAESNIKIAEQNLTLTKQEQGLQNAGPRQEELVRAAARIKKAQATIDQIDSQIGDRAVVAPFSGIVTDVNIITGETAPVSPVFTLFATDSFELVARVPEIDITRMKVGQKARAVFDAKSDTTENATVQYIALLPIQIDGVAYFEVKLTLDQIPDWLRGGLNADIDIIVDQKENTAKIPKRYLITENDTHSVLILKNNKVATTTITETFTGNDGYVAIEGLPSGTTIVTR